MVKDVIWKQDFSASLLVFCANHHFTVALYSFITAPLRCVIVLTRQYIIKSFIFKILICGYICGPTLYRLQSKKV
jgi:hypothetical protein